MAFSEPHYFYKQSDLPDLVDVNGPIYARTGVNLSNVTPVSVASNYVCANGSTWPIVSASHHSYGIVSHDVHVKRECLSPMPNDGEAAIQPVGLSGEITLSPNTSQPPAPPANVVGLQVVVMYDSFNAGGTVQGPIQIYGIVGGGEGTGKFTGVGLLTNGLNAIYDGTSFDTLTGILLPVEYGGLLDIADPITQLFF